MNRPGSVYDGDRVERGCPLPAAVPFSFTMNSSPRDGGGAHQLTMSPPVVCYSKTKHLLSLTDTYASGLLPACVLSFQENKTLCCLPALSKHYIITLNKALQSGKRRRCLLLSLKPQLHLFMFCKCLNSETFH